MLALARSQRRYSTIARVALTLSGGFAGSMLAIPIGISLSRQSLMSIEDPQHLARVLHDQMERRRRGMAQDRGTKNFLQLTPSVVMGCSDVAPGLSRIDGMGTK